MTRVGHLEIEREVSIVLVVPACQNYENCWLLLIAGLDTMIKLKILNYSMFLRFLMDFTWIQPAFSSVVKSSGIRSIN